MAAYCGGCGLAWIGRLGSWLCARACRDGGVAGTGLRTAAVVVTADATDFGRGLCSEAVRRASCSWFVLSCSDSLAICSWLALSRSTYSALSRAACERAALRS